MQPSTAFLLLVMGCGARSELEAQRVPADAAPSCSVSPDCGLFVAPSGDLANIGTRT